MRKQKFLSVRVMLALFAVYALALAPVASAAVVVVCGSMEGNLAIHSGDTIKVGYEFAPVGYSGGATTVTVSVASVVVYVNCPNGSYAQINIPIPTQTYSLPAKATARYPSNTYEASAVVSSSLCPGKWTVAYAPRGAMFTANFNSPASCIKLETQFHYSDNSPGSWSAIAVVAPAGQSCLSAPCKCCA
jgi:hypothetical protein